MTKQEQSSEPLPPMSNQSELLALADWIREPDHAEEFSLADTVDWINRRPIATVARLAASAPAGDAVAWRYELADARFWDGETPGEYTNWKWRISETKPCVSSEAIRNLTSLYARPPAVEVREHTPTSVLDVHPDVAEALTQAFEYFENRSDVSDGDYGVPEPNTEMRLAQMCSDALDRLPALSASPREMGRKSDVGEKSPQDGKEGGSEQPYSAETRQGREFLQSSKPKAECAGSISAAPLTSDSIDRKLSGPVQSWGVHVTINGVDALTIESNCLSGAPNIDDYAGTVENSALHLLSFIGRSPGPSEPSPSSRSETTGAPFYGAECPSYPNCTGGCGLGCTHEIELRRTSPDCSGCRPAGVQKEDATRIEGSMQSENAVSKSGGAA